MLLLQFGIILLIIQALNFPVMQYGIE